MAERIEFLTIEKTLPTGRLDTWLRGKLPEVSRGAIQRLIDEGCILVNGKTVKPTHTPRAGEEVEVRWPEARVALRLLAAGRRTQGRDVPRLATGRWSPRTAAKSFAMASL